MAKDQVFKDSLEYLDLIARGKIEPKLNLLINSFETLEIGFRRYSKNPIDWLRLYYDEKEIESMNLKED